MALRPFNQQVRVFLNENIRVFRQYSLVWNQIAGVKFIICATLGNGLFSPQKLIELLLFCRALFLGWEQCGKRKTKNQKQKNSVTLLSWVLCSSWRREIIIK